ncbi:MAG: PrsW family intramembrane metalloprotease [Anaerovoracaceae bacterium]|jgi:RsiW-degrading membrane proteinase PrsW (M82 family)
MTILFLAAVIPPLFLIKKIYDLDKIEKEPAGLLIKLFFLGVLMVVFAGMLETVGLNLLGGILMKGSLAYQLVEYFIVVALVEEGLKHFALKHGSWNDPAFDYRFDAVVYSTVVALGFAAAENIGYVFSYGLAVSGVRAVTAIPGHCVFGIYMGYYYGMAKYHFDMGRRTMCRFYQWISILMPVLLHGFYDFCASSRSTTLILAFYVYIILLDIIAFNQIRRFSREDQRI